MRWAKPRCGFEVLRYRAQAWEFAVDIVDAALWLGWLFLQPSDSRCPTCSDNLS